MTSTVDLDTIRLLVEHRTRIRSGAKPGDASVAELESEIRRRLKLFDADTLERVATRKDTPPLPLTPEQREAIDADIREQLKARPKAKRGGDPPATS